MSDGVRLSARIWLPEDAEEDPVPGLLEAIPYRKNDATAVTDSLRHPYFAGHGYASVRVDMRLISQSPDLRFGTSCACARPAPRIRASNKVI